MQDPVRGTGIRRGISEHAEEIIYTIEHKLFFVKAFIVCSLLVGLDPSTLIGEKKRLRKNKLVMFLFLVVVHHATKGMEMLGLAVLWNCILLTFMRAIFEKCQWLSSRVIFTFWEHQKWLPAFSLLVVDLTSLISLLWTPVVSEQ